MPRVSVLVTTYNDGAYITEALQSVVSQTFTDWELIVINDGSTDGSNEVLRKYASGEQRIRYYPHVENRGIIPCVMEALELASAQYIARLGGDDQWSDPEKLTQQVAFLDSHPDCGLLGTWAEVVDLAGRPRYIMRPAAKDADIRRQLLFWNQFIDTSVLYRKELALKAGGYRLQDRYSEDYSLALRLGRLGKVANIPQAMVRYRVNPRGVSQTKTRLQIGTALNLIKEHRASYPYYCLAVLRWRLQQLVVITGSVAALNLVKRFFHRFRNMTT